METEILFRICLTKVSVAKKGSTKAYDEEQLTNSIHDYARTR